MVAMGFGAPTKSPVTPQAAAETRVNSLRTAAGVPAVSFDPNLNTNCASHAHYMAATGTLVHSEDPGNPAYTSGGQQCGQNGDVWLGTQPAGEAWSAVDPIDGWMASPSHRLWLLYPTTRTFGYGFDSHPGTYSAAALDVLSKADFGADAAYQGWPVRYPAPDQTDVPAGLFPVTMAWQYFGPAPQLGSATLAVDGGPTLPATATTSLPSGHKGVLITPTSSMPAGTRIRVTVVGAYGGVAFSHTWTFSTRP